MSGITKNFNYKRLIAVGDVHGQITLLRPLIERHIQFNAKNDVLIFLGDYIDRGQTASDEIETMLYIQHLQKSAPKNIIVLKGNHEDMAERALKNPIERARFGGYNSPPGDIAVESRFTECWKMNGGTAFTWTKDLHERLLNWVESMPLYCLTDEFLFVHAGADSGIDLNKQSADDLLWNRYNFEKYRGRKLVIGHTPTKSKSVEISENRIMVDTGAFYTGKLSAIDVLSGNVFESK